MIECCGESGFLGYFFGNHLFGPYIYLVMYLNNHVSQPPISINSERKLLGGLWLAVEAGLGEIIGRHPALEGIYVGR